MDGHLARADLLVRRLVDHVRDHDPVQATRFGLTERDGELPDLTPEALAARSRDLAVLDAEVAAASRALNDAEVSVARRAPQDGEELSGPEAATNAGDLREARADLTLLAQEIATRRFELDERPRHVLNPLAALETIATGLHELLRFDDGTASDRRRRLDAAVQRARRIPVLLEQAGALLASAPRPHLAVAAQRLDGLLVLVRDELPRRAEQLHLDVSPARDAGEVAAEGLEAYGALLDELSEEPAADWRLGPAAHGRVLRDGLGTVMEARQIEDRAQAWLTQVHAELAELAAAGWSQRFPGEPLPTDPMQRVVRSLDDIADTAIAPDRLLPEARAALAEARAFVAALGLVDLPPSTWLRVTDVPGYLRGIPVAFVVPPPPLRPEVGCTLHLSTIPTRWDTGEVRAFLREHTPAHLRSLAIHEGYPGHFVQLEHAARHPRLARRLLSRPVFAEGWAVAVERELLAAGFGGPGTSAVAEADLRLTQRKLELRLAALALLDIGLHVGSLDDRDALRLLTSHGLLPEAEARITLTRAKVSSGQLCAYFVGAEELLDLKHARQRVEGAGFDLGRFHRALLSHGTPTVAILAAALAADAPVRRPFAASRLDHAAPFVDERRRAEG